MAMVMVMMAMVMVMMAMVMVMEMNYQWIDTEVVDNDLSRVPEITELRLPDIQHSRTLCTISILTHTHTHTHISTQEMNTTGIGHIANNLPQSPRQLLH